MTGTPPSPFIDPNTDSDASVGGHSQNGDSSPAQPGESSINASSNNVPQDGGYPSSVKKEKHRVRFNSNASATKPPREPSPPSAEKTGAAGGPSHLPVPRVRPSALRTNSTESVPRTTDDHDHDPRSEEAISAFAAQERARQMAENLRLDKEDAVYAGSIISFESHTTGNTSDGEFLPGNGEDIHLQHLVHDRPQANSTAQTGEPNNEEEEDKEDWTGQAQKLVQSYSTRYKKRRTDDESEEPKDEKAEESHPVPVYAHDVSMDGVYAVPPPKQYRGGVLSQLLKLNSSATEMMTSHKRNWSTSTLNNPHDEEMGLMPQKGGSGSASGSGTPNKRKWYEQNRSQETLANLIGASAILANPNLGPDDGKGGKKSDRRHSGVKMGPKHKRRTSSNSKLAAFLHKEETLITNHIAGTLSRQDYIIKLCRALMMYGAPTHRLEEYLEMTARVLEIESQYLYLPGCMVVSFDDRDTHTTEVRLVRCSQGIDLGKLKDTHRVYKEVMHDVIGVEEGAERLDALQKAPEKFSPWFRVLIFGLTSAVSAPFSFSARLIDLPLCFFFGCLVGFLQIIVTSKSKMYSNVFEISAVVLVSFLARAFASIGNGKIFCFSALAQGGIVMLLPGYLVLCSSLELQSKAIVPGSIRIVYAVIYSLLLGFGITVGAALWGVMDKNAVSETTCTNPMNSEVAFAFVPAFIVCISIIYQAKWRQMPVMIVIAFLGYLVNYYSSKAFTASPQIASTLGALSVGLLANLYSRIRHGVAAATLIPAIFTQVPGGLAASGGLLSGISTANMLTGSDSTSSSEQDQDHINTVVFNVAASMIQIAIGIAVGLFISALIVYPMGKRRSGLFSF